MKPKISVTPVAGSNSGEKVDIRIPAELLPILARALLEKSTKAGMWGMGCLANTLSDVARPLREASPTFLKGFEAEALAQTLKAHDEGWEITVVFVPEEGRLGICGTSPDGSRDIVLASRRVRDGECGEDLVGQLEGFFERRAVPATEASTEGHDPA